MDALVRLKLSVYYVSFKSDSLKASRVASRRLSVIVAQYTTETLSPPHFAHLATDYRLGGNQLIIQSLMVALLVIMRQIVMNRITQRVFTEEDHPIQHFLFDRAHESLTMGVQVWTLRWQAERLYPTRLEQAIERWRELRIPIVDQIALAQEKSLEGIGQLPSALLHEGGGRMGGDASNVD